MQGLDDLTTHPVLGVAGLVCPDHEANGELQPVVGEVLALARAGTNMVVNYRSDADGAQQVAEEIRGFGRRAVTQQADVSQETDVNAMFALAIEAFGTLLVVGCNAGLQRDAPFHEMSLEQWNAVIGVNLTGQFLCARGAVRALTRRGIDERFSVAAGKIVHMSSVHEMIP